MYIFHNVSLWEKVGRSASSDIAITRFGHYKNWSHSLVLFLRDWNNLTGLKTQRWLFRGATAVRAVEYTAHLSYLCRTHSSLQLLSADMRLQCLYEQNTKCCIIVNGIANNG